MHKSKEIQVSNSIEADKCLETSRFITQEEIAEDTLRSKELMKAEDDKVTTEKEIVLSVGMEHSPEVYAAKKGKFCEHTFG